MIQHIVSLWSDIVHVAHPQEAVLHTAAEYLHHQSEAIAPEYCVAVGSTIGLPRKMGGEHLLQTCCSVWAGQLGLNLGTPLFELLSRKAEEAPYRHNFGLWDGLWLPLAVEQAGLTALVERQRATPQVRRRSDLERLLEVPPGASDDDLQEALDRFMQRQRLEKRAIEIGLTVDATEDDVREREEEFTLPVLRPVRGHFPEDALAEYLRIRDRLKELRGYRAQTAAFLPAKCARCGMTIRDYTAPCRRDGGVCDDVGPDYYQRPVRLAA